MRTALVAGVVLTALTLAALPGATGQEKKRPRRGPVTLTEAARKIHETALVFDGHNDLPYQFWSKDDLAFRRYDVSQSQPKLHTDIPQR